MNKFHLWFRFVFWTFFGFSNIALGIFLINNKLVDFSVSGWIWALSSIGWFYKALVEYRLLRAKAVIDRIFKNTPPK